MSDEEESLTRTQFREALALKQAEERIEDALAGEDDPERRVALIMAEIEVLPELAGDLLLIELTRATLRAHPPEGIDPAA